MADYTPLAAYAAHLTARAASQMVREPVLHFTRSLARLLACVLAILLAELWPHSLAR